MFRYRTCSQCGGSKCDSVISGKLDHYKPYQERDTDRQNGGGVKVKAMPVLNVMKREIDGLSYGMHDRFRVHEHFMQNMRTY